MGSGITNRGSLVSSDVTLGPFFRDQNLRNLGSLRGEDMSLIGAFSCCDVATLANTGEAHLERLEMRESTTSRAPAILNEGSLTIDGGELRNLGSFTGRVWLIRNLGWMNVSNVLFPGLAARESRSRTWARSA